MLNASGNPTNNNTTKTIVYTNNELKKSLEKNSGKIPANSKPTVLLQLLNKGKGGQELQLAHTQPGKIHPKELTPPNQVNFIPVSTEEIDNIDDDTETTLLNEPVNVVNGNNKLENIEEVNQTTLESLDNPQGTDENSNVNNDRNEVQQQQPTAHRRGWKAKFMDFCRRHKTALFAIGALAFIALSFIFLPVPIAFAAIAITVGVVKLAVGIAVLVSTYRENRNARSAQNQ